MEKESRGSKLKILGCLLAAAFLQTTIVQQAPASAGQILGHIDWLLLFVVYISLQRDPLKAMVTATFAGIFFDSFSGGRAIGVSGLAYILAAFLAHRITTFIVVDNLLVRVLAVAAASLINISVRLIFYRLLEIELPVLAGGRDIAATLVFGLFANLIASILFYLVLDWIFKKDSTLRLRRSEARRRRILGKRL